MLIIRPTCHWTDVLMHCYAVQVKLTGDQQNEMTENVKNEKITVIWLADKVVLAILMLFQFQWIDNFHCILNGLHYKSLLCDRLSHSYWKIQQHNTGRNASRSFKIRPDDSATNSWPVAPLCDALWSLSLWGCVSCPVNCPEMPCNSTGDDPVCVWRLTDCT